MSTMAADALESERDWDLSTKDGWFQMVAAPARTRPQRLDIERLAALSAGERARHNAARAVWHANLGPLRTPQIDALFDTLTELCGSNRHDGGKVKPSAVLDALPGLGKSTAAIAFGRAFHTEQIACYGPTVTTPAGDWQRIPVVYLPLTSNTTMRSLNAILCRFYGLPSLSSANAHRLAARAAQAVAQTKTRLAIIDDVHFLDVSRRDGREVANHFKWLANTFPVTFLFVGVGLRERRLLEEGLSAADAAFSQTARRWTVLDLAPFETRSTSGRHTWRRLLLSIEKDLVLAGAHPGMLATDLSGYLFSRTGGHFASLMSLINRGCYRAIAAGTECLTRELLEAIRIDQAAENARRPRHQAGDGT